MVERSSDVSGSSLDFAPLTRDDLPFLLEVRNECRSYLHDDRSFDLDECQRWFRTTEPDFHVIRRDGVEIGYFRLSRYDPEASSIYVGADLHHAFRGQGLALRAYQQFLPIVQERYGVSTAELEVLSHNTRAIRLYERLGFTETGRRAAIATRDGIVVDSIVMARSITPVQNSSTSPS